MRLLVLALLAACAAETPRPALPPASAPVPAWTEDIRDRAFGDCFAATRNEKLFCRCFVSALENVQPNPEEVSREDVRDAAGICRDDA